MAASLVSSRGPVLVMSWRRSAGQVVAFGLLHFYPRFLLDKADQQLRIFLFDLGEAIFPSRPQIDCAAVSSGGQGWTPLGGHPKGLSLTAASTVAGFGHAGEKAPPYSVWEPGRPKNRAFRPIGKPAQTIFSLALLITAVAARRFDASEVGEIELNNGFERLRGRTAQQAFRKSRQPIGIDGL
jgi:hypothetical protein